MAGAGLIEWLEDCSGKRPYIDYQATYGYRANKRRRRPYRWIWNDQFRAEPAEIFFSPEETWKSDHLKFPYVFIEPHIKSRAPLAKLWPFEYFQAVVNALPSYMRVLQSMHNPGPLLEGAQPVTTTLRELAVYISSATLLITNEGLPNHIAACFDTPTIAFFGGFIDPKITGYSKHTNFYHHHPDVTGVRDPTPLARQVMESIEPSEVIETIDWMREEYEWNSRLAK